MSVEKLLSLSPVYQGYKAVKDGKLPGALFGLAGLGVEQMGKKKRKKKKKVADVGQANVGQSQAAFQAMPKTNRKGGGMVNKSKVMYGYKKGGQV